MAGWNTRCSSCRRWIGRPAGSPIATREITGEMRLLQGAGVLHLGYYPDDFLKDRPELKALRPAFSASPDLPLWDEGIR